MKSNVVPRIILFLILSMTLPSHILAKNLTINDMVRGEVETFSVMSHSGTKYVNLRDLAEFFDSKFEEHLLTQRYRITVYNQPAYFQVGEGYFFIEQLLLRTPSPVVNLNGKIYIPLESLKLLLKSFTSFAMQWNDRKQIVSLLPMPEQSNMQINEQIAGNEPVKTKEERLGGRKLRSITIDPGHGGKDSGAVGIGGLKEKDVVLKIAKLLRDELKREYGLEVFLTRESDIFLSLEKRSAIANNNKSDIFISIHTNSGRRRNAKGFEVYYLNKQPSDDFAEEAAILENLGLGDEKSEFPELSSDIHSILWDLIQNKYLVESSILAEKMLDAYEVVFDWQTRGVKQAPFYVLMGAEMPAALVEVDFISNPTQEKQLMETTYINKIIKALTRGIIDFKRHYEKILGADRLEKNN